MAVLVWVGLVCAAFYARRSGVLDLSLGAQVAGCWLFAIWVAGATGAPWAGSAAALVGGVSFGALLGTSVARRAGPVHSLVVAIALTGAVDQLLDARWLERPIAGALPCGSLVVVLACLGWLGFRRPESAVVQRGLAGLAVGGVALVAMPLRSTPGVDLAQLVAALLVAVALDHGAGFVVADRGGRSSWRFIGLFLGVLILCGYPIVAKIASTRDSGLEWVLLAKGGPSWLIAAAACAGALPSAGHRCGRMDMSPVVAWLGLGIALCVAALEERAVLEQPVARVVMAVAFGCLAGAWAGVGRSGRPGPVDRAPLALVPGIVGAGYVFLVSHRLEAAWLGHRWLPAGATGPTLLALFGLLMSHGCVWLRERGAVRAMGCAAFACSLAVGLLPSLPRVGQWGLVALAVGLILGGGYRAVTEPCGRWARPGGIVVTREH